MTRSVGSQIVMWESPEPFGRRSLLRLAGGLVGAGLGGTALTGVGSAQTAEWIRTYAYENELSGASDAVRTDGGGYVASGWVWEGMVDANAWLFELDAAGDLVWSRMYDAETGERGRWGPASALVDLPDGYAFVADDTGTEAGVWVVVTDREGSVRRSRFVDLPATGTVEGVDVVADGDGGFTVVAADVESYRPRVVETWLVGLDARLDPRWRRSYGGEGSLEPVGLVRPVDGGYAVAATRWPTAECGDADYRLLRVNAEGECRWARTYDSGGSDVVGGIAERRRDGETLGYALGGRSDRVVWAVTTDADGSLRHSRTFDPVPEGTLYNPTVADIDATDDGYAIFADVIEQYWLAETDRELRLRWEAFYDNGEPQFDSHVATALVTSDGEYGLFGEVLGGGDADTTRAFVVNAVDEG